MAAGRGVLAVQNGSQAAQSDAPMAHNGAQMAQKGAPRHTKNPPKLRFPLKIKEYGKKVYQNLPQTQIRPPANFRTAGAPALYVIFSAKDP